MSTLTELQEEKNNLKAIIKSLHEQLNSYNDKLKEIELKEQLGELKYKAGKLKTINFNYDIKTPEDFIGIPLKYYYNFLGFKIANELIQNCQDTVWGNTKIAYGKDLYTILTFTKAFAVPESTKRRRIFSIEASIDKDLTNEIILYKEDKLTGEIKVINGFKVNFIKYQNQN